MGKKKKDCTIDEDNYNYVMTIQEQEHLGSFSAALDFVINEQRQAGKKEDIIAAKVIEVLDEKHYDLLTRLRRNINAADFNTQVILEVLNTLMINLEITQSYAIKEVKNDAIKAGEAEVKNKIAYFKQLKDNSSHK